MNNKHKFPYAWTLADAKFTKDHIEPINSGDIKDQYVHDRVALHAQNQKEYVEAYFRQDKAALRAIGILREIGLTAKVLDLKPYKDPDEFIKNLGKEAFLERIENAQNSFFFEIDVLKKNWSPV